MFNFPSVYLRLTPQAPELEDPLLAPMWRYGSSRYERSLEAFRREDESTMRDAVRARLAAAAARRRTERANRRRQLVDGMRERQHRIGYMAVIGDVMS